MAKTAQVKRPLDCAHFPLSRKENVFLLKSTPIPKMLTKQASIYEPQNITKEKFRVQVFKRNFIITADEYGVVFWGDENILKLDKCSSGGGRFAQSCEIY